MKTIRFFFATVGFGVLILGITYADPPSAQPSGKDAAGTGTTSNHRTDPTQGTQGSGTAEQADRKGSSSNADNHAPEKVSQARPEKTAPKKPTVKNPSQSPPAMNKPTAVAKAGLPANKPGINSVPLAKPTVVGGTAVLVPALVRKQAGPTASLGGLTASSIKTSTSGINGTGMQRTIYR